MATAKTIEAATQRLYGGKGKRAAQTHGKRTAVSGHRYGKYRTSRGVKQVKGGRRQRGKTTYGK
jgi:hypothetical protein